MSARLTGMLVSNCLYVPISFPAESYTRLICDGDGGTRSGSSAGSGRNRKAAGITPADVIGVSSPITTARTVFRDVRTGRSFWPGAVDPLARMALEAGQAVVPGRPRGPQPGLHVRQGAEGGGEPGLAPGPLVG